MLSNKPVISIIVSVLNAQQTLKRCLKSIVNQGYAYKEIIVIDGGSTDGSLSIINKYSEFFAYWETAPDRGIYHAWNKALKYAKGEWICFLGADDYFWDEYVLSNLIPYLKKAEDEKTGLVYGQVARVNDNGHIIKILGKPWQKIKWQLSHGMPLDMPHPGLMHKRSIFEKHGLFDESFKIAGDYDLLLRELKTGKAFYAEGLRTVGCQIGGIADSSGIRSHLEVKKARKKNGYNYFSLIWGFVYLRALIRKIFNIGKWFL